MAFIKPKLNGSVFNLFKTPHFIFHSNLPPSSKGLVKFRILSDFMYSPSSNLSNVPNLPKASQKTSSSIGSSNLISGSSIRVDSNLRFISKRNVDSSILPQVFLRMVSPVSQALRWENSLKQCQGLCNLSTHHDDGCSLGGVEGGGGGGGVSLVS